MDDTLTFLSRDQIRSETSVCSLKDSNRLNVIQNRREPPTKPRTGLRTKGRPTGSNAKQLHPFAHDPSQLSRRMQSADSPRLKNWWLILRPVHCSLRLHRRPDCDEECEVVDADSSVLLRLRATIGKRDFFVEPMRMVATLHRKSLRALEKSGRHNVPGRIQEVSGVVHNAGLCVIFQHSSSGTCRSNISATNFTSSNSPCHLQRRNQQ